MSKRLYTQGTEATERLERSIVTLSLIAISLHIKLAPADRPFHSFLWRDMEDREPDQYEFNRLVFGVNSCPFQAQLVTRRNAEENMKDVPRSSRCGAELVHR